MIIGITGTIGAGKGTVVEYLKSRGFGHYSSSATLKRVLRERNLPETRTHMSPLADELMRQYEGGILHLSHKQAEAEGVDHYILEAIHREEEAAFLRKIGGVLIGIDADLRTRYERSVKRGEGAKDDVTFEEFLEHVEREEEGQGGGGPNIRKVLLGADAIVFNDGSLEDLHGKLESVLAGFPIDPYDGSHGSHH